VDWIQVLVLSLVQGLTEFLPVSSSAHLILVPELMGWKDQGLAFDIAVHLGTLIAVLGYFRAELLQMLVGFRQVLKGQLLSFEAKLMCYIAFATLPVGLCGLLFKNFVATTLRSPLVIAFTTLAFGLLLGVADRWGRKNRLEQSLNWQDIVMIGCSQAISLIPGTSRSGITLSAGLFMGLTREAAARFSFLLSIPVIILAGGLEAFSLLRAAAPFEWGSLGLGVMLSGLSGYFCIHYFLKLLNKYGLFPFVLYRLGLGIFLLFTFLPRSGFIT